MAAKDMGARRAAVVILGATGDLALRMLLPSLFALHEEGLIAPDFRILGTARRTLGDSGFRQMAEQALLDHLPDAGKRKAHFPKFLDRLRYAAVDTSKPDDFATLKAAFESSPTREPAIFLSAAPALFEATIAGLASAGIDGGNARIALEKPLGHDLASSRLINDAVARSFPEEKIFRIDHYLGKETVQNLLALRFGNALFEPLWNASHIDHVQITVAETVGLEGRKPRRDVADLRLEEVELVHDGLVVAVGWQLVAVAAAFGGGGVERFLLLA